MKQKCYVIHCNLYGRGIGDGMCCLYCDDIKRPENPKPGQICEHEEVVRTYEREV